MTGKDLLDAIGSVDESLLERCQQTEQLTAKNHILWYWYRKKYISIAACACLLLLSTVGVTYWRSDFFSVSDTVVNGNTPGITTLSDVYQPEEPERFPRQEKQDGTDSDVAKDTVNETRQDSSSSSINGTINDNYPADDLPDTDISSGTKSGVETTPKNSENTDTLQSPNEQITKVDETDSITPNYSQGIEIEPVKEVPKGAPSSEETVQPEGMHKPAKGGGGEEHSEEKYHHYSGNSKKYSAFSCHWRGVRHLLFGRIFESKRSIPGRWEGNPAERKNLQGLSACGKGFPSSGAQYFGETHKGQ